MIPYSKEPSWHRNARARRSLLRRCKDVESLAWCFKARLRLAEHHGHRLPLKALKLLATSGAMATSSVATSTTIPAKETKEQKKHRNNHVGADAAPEASVHCFGPGSCGSRNSKVSDGKCRDCARPFGWVPPEGVALPTTPEGRQIPLRDWAPWRTSSSAAKSAAPSSRQGGAQAGRTETSASGSRGGPITPIAAPHESNVDGDAANAKKGKRKRKKGAGEPAETEAGVAAAAVQPAHSRGSERRGTPASPLVQALLDNSQPQQTPQPPAASTAAPASAAPATQRASADGGSKSLKQSEPTLKGTVAELLHPSKVQAIAGKKREQAASSSDGASMNYHDVLMEVIAQDKAISAKTLSADLTSRFKDLEDEAVVRVEAALDHIRAWKPDPSGTTFQADIVRRDNMLKGLETVLELRLGPSRPSWRFLAAQTSRLHRRKNISSIVSEKAVKQKRLVERLESDLKTEKSTLDELEQDAAKQVALVKTAETDIQRLNIDRQESDLFLFSDTIKAVLDEIAPLDSMEPEIKQDYEALRTSLDAFRGKIETHATVLKDRRLAAAANKAAEEAKAAEARKLAAIESKKKLTAGLEKAIEDGRAADFFADKVAEAKSQDELRHVIGMAQLYDVTLNPTLVDYRNDELANVGQGDVVEEDVQGGSASKRGRSDTMGNIVGVASSKEQPALGSAMDTSPFSGKVHVEGGEAAAAAAEDNKKDGQ